ncbi:MAG: formate C-acetyltransferase/glycerol dehydratase family glycyl radical enzyme, partial [Candidatus Lokiarchaeota archaeon]|nr:formate C-acetyltransferase/glycerol dehydratase family glycyl radical enzyme [Candidatus Lokiarchaeota archaeon]MBD3341738.1 formate C-acetyltransferase/glycerol dehydratase family glycyl radical enzyme [Candidatus Lokiarchaeota archaeon]
MKVESFSKNEYLARMENVRDKVQTHPHEICVERAKLFTESYKQTKGEHPFRRFAKAMEYVLNNLTIKIWANEFIVGNRTKRFVGIPLYPEVRVDIIEQDVDTYEKRPAQKMLITEEERRVLKEEIIPYWKNKEKTVKKAFLSELKPKVKQIMDTLVYTVETEVTNGVGHFFPGHDNILKLGIKGLIHKAEKSLENHAQDNEKAIFLESTIRILKAVKNFVLRYSNLATQMTESEQDENRRGELKEVAEICNHISVNPPRSFKEALQLIFFNHLICDIEDGGFAISVGRLDQLLYPFFLKDKESGELTNEKALFLIELFFLKINRLWNYIFYLGVNAAEGPPIAQNLTIGGLDRDGNDATNELSYIILDAYAHLKTVQPTFSVRVHDETPDSLLVKVGEAIRSGASIALFNDELMIPGLVKRGFSLEDAREYAPIGCVEPQHPHKSYGSTNANQFNLVKCLELALTNGTDLFLRRDIGVKYDSPITSYEDLWERFIDNVKYFIKYMVWTMDALDKTIAEINPQMFLSSTTDECIKRGLDVTQGGAIYDFTGPQFIGLATTADSLAVVKKIVFEKQLLTIDELVQLLKKNYRGSYKDKKGEEWRQIFVNRVPKFGNDEDYVDHIAADIVKLCCKEVEKYTNYRGGKYNPGLYSTSLHLAFGSFTGASADGRKSREPLSNGLCPTHGCDKLGPTAILNSNKKLSQELLTNGDALTLAFHPNSLKTEVFLPLIKTYFTKDGGYQIQFNVVGKDILCDAQKNPANYHGLVVRIAGYSVYFTELSKNAQDEIIARTEY